MLTLLFVIGALRVIKYFSTRARMNAGKGYLKRPRKAGKNVQEYVDHYANEFRTFQDVLNLDSPTFIRTTDPKHIHATAMWSR
jgi:capsule polysaccharide modification protein KpsS